MLDAMFTRCPGKKDTWFGLSFPQLQVFFFLIVYLFHLKMHTDNRYILSASLLPELIELLTWAKGINGWTLGLSLQNSPSFSFPFAEGCLWRKLDSLFAYSNIFSWWLYVPVQLTLLTIWVKWGYWIMFVANYNCFGWLLPLVTLFTVKKTTLKNVS